MLRSFNENKNYTLKQRKRVSVLLFFCGLVALFSTPSSSTLAYTPQEFVTVWKTNNPGTSNATSITIPTHGTGYNYDIDWTCDGTFDVIGATGTETHDYGTAETYTVCIRGQFPQIYFNNGGDRQKILEVQQWGGRFTGAQW